MHKNTLKLLNLSQLRPLVQNTAGQRKLDVMPTCLVHEATFGGRIILIHEYEPTAALVERTDVC